MEVASFKSWSKTLLSSAQVANAAVQLDDTLSHIKRYTMNLVFFKTTKIDFFKNTLVVDKSHQMLIS